MASLDAYQLENDTFKDIRQTTLFLYNDKVLWTKKRESRRKKPYKFLALFDLHRLHFSDLLQADISVDNLPPFALERSGFRLRISDHTTGQIDRDIFFRADSEQVKMSFSRVFSSALYDVRYSDSRRVFQCNVNEYELRFNIYRISDYQKAVEKVSYPSN